MTNFWDMNFYYGKFKLFSKTHILTLVVIIGVILLIYLFKEKFKKNNKLDTYVRIKIAVIMLLAEGSFYYWAWVHGVFDWGNSLPLNICGINVYLSVLLLFNKKYFIYEILFFTGLLGEVQAILTPDISFTFPHFRYIQFFATHACVLITIFYMTFVYDFKPKAISIIKAYIVLIIYAIPVGIFNILIGGNYLFLAHKPQSASLLDYLGSWPWYIVVMLTAILPYFLLIYLLFNLICKLTGTCKKLKT